MGKSRLVLHPLLTHRRSRFIFFIYLGIACAAGVLCWFRLEGALKDASLTMIYGLPTENILLSMLLSSHFRIGLVLATAVFAAGLTAHLVIGPVKRIVEWLNDVAYGRNPGPLQVRYQDKFSRLVDLINRFAKKN